MVSRSTKNGTQPEVATALRWSFPTIQVSPSTNFRPKLPLDVDDQFAIVVFREDSPEERRQKLDELRARKAKLEDLRARRIAAMQSSRDTGVTVGMLLVEFSCDFAGELEAFCGCDSLVARMGSAAQKIPRIGRWRF